MSHAPTSGIIRTEAPAVAPTAIGRWVAARGTFAARPMTNGPARIYARVGRSASGAGAW